MNKLKHENCIIKYNQQPKLCKHCTKIIPYEQRRNDYCNHSCRASETNKGGNRNKQYFDTIRGYPKNNKCPNCDNPVKINKYCSHKCELIHHFKEKVKANIQMSGGTIRAYLKLTRTRKCEVCNLTHWNNQPIPLEGHHIDGDHLNNTDENLQLICLNCHGLTDTYKNKNKGNGRDKRRVVHNKNNR